MALSTSSIMRFALGLRDWMLSLLSIILLLLLVFWLSAFLYGSFYYIYMPSQQSYTMPVHFGFEPCFQQDSKVGEKCSFLNASVVFARERIQFLPGQKYSVALELQVPMSEKNRNCGMILICSEMKKSSGSLSGESCRTALLPYKSSFTETIESVILTPFQLLGYVDFREKIVVEFFTDFVDDPHDKTEKIEIEIKSRYFDLYRASLIVHAHFTGLRHLMYHHPAFSSLLGISSFATLVFTLLFFFWKKFFEPKVIVTATLLERQKKAKEILSQSENQQKILRKVSLTSPHRSMEQEVAVNSDEEKFVDFQVGQEDLTLRKRHVE